MADGGFNIPNGFNLGIPNQHHNPNQQQQQGQPHIPPGVTSPQNGALWNELQQRYVNQVQHTQQLNQNATKMLYQAQAPHLQQSLQQNQLPNGNPLNMQQFRLNPQAAAAAVAAARQNQQGGAGLNPGLLGVGGGGGGGGPAPTGANGNLYNLATGQVPAHLGREFAALNRAKQDTRIFQGPNAPPNGSQQQQQSQPGVPGLPGLGLASGGVGNGGGGGGPVEALQNQNQNSLLQFAAQRLNGLTPRQIANMNPQQREQLWQLRENQQQQQTFAQAQAQHQLQQQQQQQPPQLASQIPGLGQMGQSSTGFSNGQQPPWAQGPPQSNGIDGAVFLEQFVNLPIEAFRNHLINFKTKIKALEEQRDRLLQIKTPQMIEQAQRVQAQMNGLQNVMEQLTEAYTRRQPMSIQQAAAGGPSGQQAGQPAIQARL